MRFFILDEGTFLSLTCFIILNIKDMKLRVNDKEVETKATTLSQLSLELSLPQAGIAVAINQRMIPRTEWDVCPLHDGDSIIIIKAVCGG